MRKVISKWTRIAGRISTPTAPLLCISLLIAILIAGPMLSPDTAQASGTIATCADCHGNPPVDGTARNNPVGQFPGSHNVHAGTAAGQYGIKCEVCHVAPVHTSMTHQTDTVQVNLRWISFAGGIMQNGSVSGWGSYSRGTSFTNWSTMPGTNFGTCVNTYCHSKGDGGTLNASDPRAISASTSPKWGTVTPNCSPCHGNETGNPGTGAPWYTSNTGGAKANSHQLHAPGASGAGVCSRCHYTTTNTGNTITSIGNHIKRSYTVAAGTGLSFTYSYSTSGGTCSTVTCHGGATSMRWGSNNNAAAGCTKCHGVKGTTAAQYSAEPKTAAPGWNTLGVDTSSATGTYVNNVSNDPQVGAHFSHLANPKGYSGGVVCESCHAVPADPYDANHMNGAVNMTWSSLVRNQSLATKWSTVPLTPAYTGGNCSVNYCHGYSAWTSVRGTSWTSLVSWTNTGYLSNSAATKNATDCNRCHASPPTASTIYDHSATAMPSGLATDCAGCHNHNGAGSEHINGVLYGGGACNSCHWYDTTETGAWTTSAKPASGTYNSQGGKLWLSTNAWGAHVKHINHLKTRYGASLVPATDQYGVTAGFNQVCGFCHSTNSSDHNNTGRKLWTTSTHQFGAAALSWGTVTRQCSNLDCHYKITPVW